MVARYPSRRSPVLADNVVSTSHPLATQAGISMLKQGGNAIDAALGAAIALTILEPTGNGIGSDGFAIVWDGSALHGLNASGCSPAGWSPEYFSNPKRKVDRRRGWDSITVPGAVAGWVELSKRFGRLPFCKLFDPAIDYAENGFLVSPVIAALWKDQAEILKTQPGFEKTFLIKGRSPAAGDRFFNLEAGQSLALIAKSEGEAFYKGQLAEKIVSEAKAHGAVLSFDDLAENSPHWCGTIQKPFDNFVLHEIPPNGQGIAACMVLGILQNTPIRELEPESPQALHLMWEAMKLAFADIESYVADPIYMKKVSVSALLNDYYLAQRASLIDPERAKNFGAGKPGGGGTVYLCAADAQGNMISYIQSNYEGFGSGVVVPGTGIHLQNRGAGFNLCSGHPNEVGPRKKPFHTIIPGFLTKANVPQMAFGVMGGGMQAQGHIQMVLRTQIWDQDVQTAVDAPRWRILGGMLVACEAEMPSVSLQVLAKYGHDIKVEAPDAVFGFGGAQIIHRLARGGYAAGSDPRKDGCAAGF